MFSSRCCREFHSPRYEGMVPVSEFEEAVKTPRFINLEKLLGIEPLNELVSKYNEIR